MGRQHSTHVRACSSARAACDVYVRGKALYDTASDDLASSCISGMPALGRRIRAVEKWLSYKKVRLVVNCINKRTPDGIMNPLWEETSWAREALDQVRFIDWSASQFC